MSLKPPSLPDLQSKASPSPYSPSQTHDRSMFFRSEYDGILVYDFNSRLSTTLTETSDIIPEVVTSKPKIKGISDYGKNQIDRQQFESMKSYTAQRQYFPQYTLVVPKDNVLVFDSRFESGNLHKAIKVSENEYNLLLNYDTETLGHTQWYYFSVRNYKKNHAVRFNIINLMKFESLYSEGMKPAVLSMEKKRRTGIEWHQDGYNLGYYQNTYKRSVVLPGCQEKSKYYYTLTFTYKFDHYPDTVYFSYSYPYTYSDLSSYLSSLSSNPSYQKYLRINPICKSLAGNPCYSLTITNKIKSYTDWKDENDKLNKSSAARRQLKIRELKEEAKSRYHEGKLTDEGKK